MAEQRLRVVEGVLVAEVQAVAAVEVETSHLGKRSGPGLGDYVFAGTLAQVRDAAGHLLGRRIARLSCGRPKMSRPCHVQDGAVL